MASYPSEDSDTEVLKPTQAASPSYGHDSVSQDISSGSMMASLLHHTKARVWTIAGLTFIVCLAPLLTGFVLGYSSDTLLELSEWDPVHGIRVGSTQSNLFGAMASIGALVGGLFAGGVSDHLGRKTAIMLGGLPHLIGWLMLTYAHLAPTKDGFLVLLQMGRVFTGFAAGWGSLCVPVYISEISTAKLKGLFGACNQLFVTIGIFMVYILGAVNSWVQDFEYYHVSLIAIGIVAILEVLMLLTVETPRWWVSHHRPDRARGVLKLLRGPKYYINKELEGIEKKLEKQERLSFKQVLLEFRHRSVYIPLLLALGLALFQQFSGINAAIFYAAAIFKQAGVGNPSLVSSFAVGGVQIVITLLSVLLIDLTGRRVLLIIGSIGLCISSTMLGAHFYLTRPAACNLTIPACDIASQPTYACNNHFAPLAITSLVIFISAFSIAWGAIPWVMMSELTPLRVRGLCSGIVTAFNWTLAAVVTGAYQDYQCALQPWFAWWSFGIVMFVSIFFVLFLLPETKGHTLEEIQDYFEHRHGRKRLEASDTYGTVN